MSTSGEAQHMKYGWSQHRWCRTDRSNETQHATGAADIADFRMDPSRCVNLLMVGDLCPIR